MSCLSDLSMDLRRPDVALLSADSNKLEPVAVWSRDGDVKARRDAASTSATLKSPSLGWQAAGRLLMKSWHLDRLERNRKITESLNLTHMLFLENSLSKSLQEKPKNNNNKVLPKAAWIFYLFYFILFVGPKLWHKKLKEWRRLNVIMYGPNLNSLVFYPYGIYD